METYRKYLPAAGAVALLVLVWLTFFTVRETEVVFITQFGRPLYTVTDAGLHVKWPFQTANYFDRRLRIYNPGSSEFLTRDKKNLVIESYVAWKIEDPKRFIETVGDPFGAAENRLHDIVWSGLSAALGTHDLESIVSSTSSSDCRDGRNARSSCQPARLASRSLSTASGGRCAHQAPEPAGAEQAERLRPNASRTRTHRQTVSRGG